MKAFLQYAESVVRNPSKVRSLYLWTERGANRHCKILDTDRAWEQFDVLEENYFNTKEQGAQFKIPQTLGEALRFAAKEDRMRDIKNKEIRLAIESAGLKQWQVAAAFGIHEGNFSRKLRHELDNETKAKVMVIIKELCENGGEQI